MIKKQKPIMGTRLVPSVENIEGCHKYGGRWDRIEEICFERMVPAHFPRYEGYSGCTAPIKGISVCWGTDERNRINFVDHILTVTGALVKRKSRRYESEFGDSAEPYAKEEYFYIRESGNKKLLGKKIKQFVCINPLGKITDCNGPNAIFTNKGKNITAITHSLREYRKVRPLADVTPRQYTPVDREYKKGRQMEVVHLSDDLAVLMRKNRDTNNDKDYFPADAKKSIHPPLKEMEIPSIESIRHCFDHGGYWNGWWNVCVRKNGCVGPHKGVECCYDATETEDIRIIPDKEEDEEYDYRYEPTVWCKIVGKTQPDEDFWNEDRMVWDSSEDGYFSDYWRPDEMDGYHYPDDCATAERAAKSTAIDMMHSIATGYQHCYTPEGREVKHTDPRAICAPKEKVLKIYGGKR